jgi:hypothetical protein
MKRLFVVDGIDKKRTGYNLEVPTITNYKVTIQIVIYKAFLNWLDVHAVNRVQDSCNKIKRIICWSINDVIYLSILSDLNTNDFKKFIQNEDWFCHTVTWYRSPKLCID